jgi:hypothetical protein
MRRPGWALLGIAIGAASAAAQPSPLPIFDAHIHYSAPDWSSHPPERVLAILDGAGVSRALVSSTPDDGTVRLYEKAPARIVPELRPYRTRADMAGWWQDASIVAYLESRLQRKIYRGIGEFHLHGGQTGTPVIRRVVELAVRDGLILHAHSDERAVVELFGIDPRVRILWAHAGMSSGPEAVGALLDRHPNLWVELALRYGDVAPGGALDPRWRALFLRHPDRFLVGTDTWVTSRWDAVAPSAAEARRFLGELPREVAEQIAFRNADRLYPR